jgi:NAD(P)-dependent dehydrogenase (short-subunit alcohol dehydrogenase family)
MDWVRRSPCSWRVQEPPSCCTQERLDVLVNNAGIGTTLPGGGARQESEDGYELRFAINYLAPFLLTRLLLPTLRQSAPARIVNVSSAGHAPINFLDVMLEQNYDGVQAYCQSKLALVMFTFDLAEELAGTGVTANCLHPATYMPTKMVLAARGSSVSTIEEGVQATTHLITAPELDQISGRYFNGLREARAESQAYDRQARRQLRQLSDTCSRRRRARCCTRIRADIGAASCTTCARKWLSWLPLDAAPSMANPFRARSPSS